LQDANEELQAANEELMLTQEELQATNEEFEATNEELQATNEELETNNEELQATNEELQTTNDELSARSTELHELTRQNRVEQSHLSEVLERFPYYIMVLDASDLTVQSVNPGYSVPGHVRQLVGRPVNEVFKGIDLETFLHTVQGVIEAGQPVTTGPLLVNAAETKDGERFVHTIVPVREAQGNVRRLFIYSELAGR